MTIPIKAIIVEKTGELKEIQIKDFDEDALYKKCGFKTSAGFNNYAEWNVKINDDKYIINVFGKTSGRANSENKYDFPPPIDSTLFFGSCAITAKTKDEDNYTDLTMDLWLQIYESLFGGFEDLDNTAKEDEEEEDELELIPGAQKTKSGYLKDGFVVDDSTESDEDNMSDYELSEEEYISED
uniref:Uncharacterized protein n=1 Tax=viral metagenome TaxID=1070528 RepID=A0A6C0LNX9_9ZZZZ